MRLSIRHITTYRYDAPQRAVLQSQRLTPSVSDSQLAIDWQITTTGGVTGSVFRDGAGDETWLVRVPGPLTEVTVEVNGMIETRDLSGLLTGHREKVVPEVYLRGTRVTRPDRAIGELAATAMAAAAGDGLLAQTHALSNAVHEAVAFTSDTTSAETTAAEALALGRGVCQDHTHVLIAAARHAGIPARYAAGYLYSGAGEGEEGTPLVGSEASHAWAELFVHDLGWVGFDAANACCPDQHYIRLCSGYDAFDAAPIRGVSSGFGRETLDVSVAVTAVQQ